MRGARRGVRGAGRHIRDQLVTAQLHAALGLKPDLLRNLIDFNSLVAKIYFLLLKQTPITIFHGYITVDYGCNQWFTRLLLCKALYKYSGNFTEAFAIFVTTIYIRQSRS